MTSSGTYKVYQSLPGCSKWCVTPQIQIVPAAFSLQLLKRHVNGIKIHKGQVLLAQKGPITPCLNLRKRYPSVALDATRGYQSSTMSPGLSAMVSAVASVAFSSFLKLMFSGTFTVIKGVVGSLIRTGI